MGASIDHTALGFAAAEAWLLKHQLEKILKPVDADWAMIVLPVPEGAEGAPDSSATAKILNGNDAFKIIIDAAEITVRYFSLDGWLRFLVDAKIIKKGERLKFSDNHKETFIESRNGAYAKRIVDGKEFNEAGIQTLIKWMMLHWPHPLESEIYREPLTELFMLLEEKNPYRELRWRTAQDKKTSLFVALWHDCAGTLKTATRREKSFAKYAMRRALEKEVPPAERPLEFNLNSKLHGFLLIFNAVFMVINLWGSNWNPALLHLVLAVGNVITVMMPVMALAREKRKARKKEEKEDQVEKLLKNTQSELARLLE